VLGGTTRHPHDGRKSDSMLGQEPVSMILCGRTPKYSEQKVPVLWAVYTGFKDIMCERKDRRLNSC
jgi:hypothetical protein